MITSNNKITSILSLCFVFIFVFSCSSPSESKIIGKWKMDHTNNEMMEFFKDGTFKTYKSYRYGPALGYSGVKTENGYYKTINSDTLEMTVGEDKSKIVRINVKFSDENSMTLSFPQGETLFTLTRAR